MLLLVREDRIAEDEDPPFEQRACLGETKRVDRGALNESGLCLYETCPDCIEVLQEQLVSPNIWKIFLNYV